MKKSLAFVKELSISSATCTLPPAKPAHKISGTKIAKDNGLGGAHLRVKPTQLSAEGNSSLCVLKTDTKLDFEEGSYYNQEYMEVAVKNAEGCPEAKGKTVYIFINHFK